MSVCRFINGVCWGFIGDDRTTFLRRDKGGSIYVLREEGFRPYPIGATRSKEYVTTECVTPLVAIRHTSALAAMLGFGVRLYFVDLPSIEQLMDAQASQARVITDIASKFPCENDIFDRSFRPRDGAAAGAATCIQMGQQTHL